MTTICYRDGTLAADTLGTDGSRRAGRLRKIWKTADGHLCGAVGVSSILEVYKVWSEHREGAPPHDNDDHDTTVILVSPQGEFQMYGRYGWTTPEFDFFAVGSGEDIAIGAMAMGATAEQAVKIAIDFDVYSGGEVQSVRLGPDTQPIEDDDHESGAVEVDPLTPEERAALNAELDKPRPETWRERHGLV